MIVLLPQYDMTSPSGFLSPDSPSPGVEAAYARLEGAGFADALWSRHLEIWSTDAHEQHVVDNRLGWLVTADTVGPQLARVKAAAAEVRTAGFTDIVLLGMGGSSLAPEVIRHIIGVAEGWPRFRMLDSVNPAAVRDAMSHAASSLFVVASKSGTTIEPTVMTAEAKRRVEAAGHRPWGSRFMAITDRGTLLHHRAESDHFRHVFLNPSDIGGRYSALSLFGLVPAALMGIDPEMLLSRTARMADACRTAQPRSNPGLALGAEIAAAALLGRDKLTLLLPDALSSLGLWVEQLVAESTGKNGLGVVPITGEPVLPRYGRDRLAVSVSLPGLTPDAGALGALRAAGSPVVELLLPDPLSLGAEFLRWEVATAAAGWLLGVNPFTEPDVQRAKDATRSLIDTYHRDGQLPAPEVHASDRGATITISQAARRKSSDPARFLSSPSPGDYLAILAYLSPGDVAYADTLGHFRAEVGRRAGIATMLGFGPRYLHSTGQLHKGGPAGGIFLVVTAEPDEDLSVPGHPHSFGLLESAQGLGDFMSLDQLGRRCLLVRLPSLGAGALDSILSDLLSGL